MRKIMLVAVTASMLAMSTTLAQAAGNDAAQPDRSVGQTISDAAVTAKVKAALAVDEVTKARNIDVDTRQGAVTLSGAVDSKAEIEHAARVARSVEGVGTVDNKLVTK